MMMSGIIDGTLSTTGYDFHYFALSGGQVSRREPASGAWPRH